MVHQSGDSVKAGTRIFLGNLLPIRVDLLTGLVYHDGARKEGTVTTDRAAPTFAERLRQLRLGAGLTQEQLASAAALPLGSIRNYEQGQREPYWQVVFRLAAALGTDATAFAGCVGTEPPQAPPKKARGRRKGGGA
jgi:DNA-binding XRE family transcriptional regulator